MARKRGRRRARRHNPPNPRRRRRRNPLGALGANPSRRRRRRHNPVRRHRRRRHNPFGLGKGRGLLAAMPSMPVLLGAVAGGVGTPIILSKFGLLEKLPGVKDKTGKINLTVTGLYTAGIGVVLGGLMAKFAGKQFGYSFAMGAAVVQLATLAMAKVAPVAGLGFDGGAYEMSGGGYNVSGAIPELEGMGEIDELEGLGEEIPELEGAF